jgi:hypothetical protein
MATQKNLKEINVLLVWFGSYVSVLSMQKIVAGHLDKMHQGHFYTDVLLVLEKLVSISVG